MATDPIRDVVTRLVAEDVHLYVDGAELKYRARQGGIREADKKWVKENKAAIIEYLCKLQLTIEQPVPPPPIVPVARSDDGLALSYAQQRLWFIDRLGKGSAQYNMAGSYVLAGELDVG